MTINVKIENNVALITMDDGKVNAINFELMDALNAALDRAEKEAKAIVLTGRPDRFSAGFDLKAFTGFTRDDAARLLDRASGLVLRLFAGPLPSIAACNGHAIAMGAFLLLACDTRIGVQGDYKIGANETLTNMRLPVFAVELLRERISKKYLTRATVQAEIYDPAGAAKAGFLDAICEEEQLLPQAMALAAQLAAMPGAYSWNRAALRQGAVERIRASIGNHPNI